MADTYPKNTIDDNGLKKVWDMAMDRLGLKVDKEVGKGLSTNDYTTTEKDKLAGIESGAEVNTVTSVAGKTGAVTLNKSDVGLGNVGNFKAVSTSANQGLTNTEKLNARANIDTPSNGDIESSKTLKSSVVTVTDAAPINAEDITVDITPQQDLHGYDKPWAGGAGKNKADATYYQATAMYQQVVSASFKVQSGKRYAFSFDTPNSGYTVYRQTPSILGFSSFSEYAFALDGTRKTFYGDCIEDKVISNIQVLGSHSTTEEGETIYVTNFMIEEIPSDSTSSTDYEPYSNICPIEGRTGAELDRVGKNWLPMTVAGLKAANTEGIWSGNTYTVNGITITVLTDSGDNVTEIQTDGISTSLALFLLYDSTNLGGESVTLTGCPENGSGGTYQIQMYNVTDQTYEGLGGDYGNGMTFTPDANKRYRSDIVVRKNQNMSGKSFYPMLRLATETDSTYEPYQGQQYTINFGETVYGCTVDFNTGKVVVNQKYVDLSDLTYTVSSVYKQTYIPDIKPPASNIIAVNAVCEKYNIVARKSTDNNGDAAVNTDKYLLIRTSDDPDGGFCYELATPYTLTLTPAQLKMLKGTNTLTCNGATITLKYQPDNVIGELKGEIEDNIIYEDFKWTTNSSQSYSAGTPGTYGTSSWRDVKKEGYDVIGVTFVENRRFGDCILTLYYIPSTSRVEVIIFRATSSSVTIADEDIEYRVAYKKRT